jgi:dimethylaniline monooxygenase (N-oxide forming)
MTSDASQFSNRLKLLSEPVGILGAGVAGLINAHVLLQDGFTNVTVITRDRSVGGVWSKDRVYPGLRINKYVATILYINREHF